MKNGTSGISNEYAGAIVDTRARIYHNASEPRMTLQLPQAPVAQAFVAHFAAGELNAYRSPQNGRFYNEIILQGDAVLRVLEVARPYLISARRYDADRMLEEHAEHVALLGGGDDV